MKKMALLSTFLLVAVAGTANAGTYSGGTGEPNDPYKIATAEDLNDIGNHSEDWDKHFLLVADINLADYTGTQFKIIGEYTMQPYYVREPFTGVFDGNFHTIRNFTYTSVPTASGYIGLFGYLGVGGEIRDLGLEDVNLDAGDGASVGALVGRNEGTISKCYATGAVRGDVFVGGLVGYSDDEGTILNCYAVLVVTGEYDVGGMVGDNSGTVANCHGTGSVSGDRSVGGLVGRGTRGEISDCFATGPVNGSRGVGGLVGTNLRAIVSECFATGRVVGEEDVGGLVGWNRSGRISDSGATGPVTGNESVGGLIGSGSGKISDCHASGGVRGRHNVGGLAGTGAGEISNCYSTGAVSGDTQVGGLLGDSYGRITNCYAAGAADGNDLTGGLVGCHESGSYVKCFWDSDLNPDANGVGNLDDPNVIGKPTAKMRKESTFTEAGWDFAQVWDIGENQTYPFLRRHPPGDTNCDAIVNFLDLAILASNWLKVTEP